MVTKVKWKSGMHLDEYNRRVKEEQYEQWVSRMERVLYAKVQEDIDDKGIYFDDDIGNSDYICAVETVVESMTRALWDDYSNHIDDIITEEIGSDSYN